VRVVLAASRLRVLRPAATLVALALAVSACSGDDTDEGEAEVDRSGDFAIEATDNAEFEGTACDTPPANLDAVLGTETFEVIPPDQLTVGDPEADGATQYYACGWLDTDMFTRQLVAEFYPSDPPVNFFTEPDAFLDCETLELDGFDEAHMCVTNDEMLEPGVSDVPGLTIAKLEGLVVRDGEALLCRLDDQTAPLVDLSGDVDAFTEACTEITDTVLAG